MRLLTSLTVCILLAAACAHASIQVTETLLTPWGTNQDDPVISWPYVVYVDSGGGNDDVHMLVDGFGPYVIANGPSEQNEPAIDDSLVVYVDDAAGKGDIFIYNIRSAETQRLTYAASDETNPAISDSNIVYLSDRAGHQDVYRYLVKQQLELPVTASAESERAPALDGDLVAWHVYETNNYNVRAARLDGESYAVATTAVTERNPAVSGSLIAYVRDNSDIAVYDVSTGHTEQIDAQADYVDRVFIEGHSLVYASAATPGEDFDVFLHDLDTSETFQLTDDSHDQYLTDMDGNRAVFWDRRTGDKNVYMLEWFFNEPPVADAGEDQYVDEGDTVYLSGDATDPEGNPITEWQWSFSQLPFGSLADLDDPASQTPSFAADMPGDYVLSLAVTDGMDWSDPDHVTITAAPPCAEPVAILDVDPTEGEAPLEVTFDASDSYDLYDPELYFEWDFGDGSPFEYDPIVVHTYTDPDEYGASLYLYNGCGESTWVPIPISVSATGVPDDVTPRFALYPSVPNPFTGETTIAYDLLHASSVELSIYDVSGRLVRRLRSSRTEGPGRHEAMWDGRDATGSAVASGTYIYRLETPEFEAEGRMTLLK